MQWTFKIMLKKKVNKFLNAHLNILFCHICMFKVFVELWYVKHKILCTNHANIAWYGLQTAKQNMNIASDSDESQCLRH